MQELKLFLVYHLGENPCWNLRIARSREEALMQCFDHTLPNNPSAREASCRVEEVTFEGYKLTIEKIG